MKITGFETIRLGEFPNCLWLHVHIALWGLFGQATGQPLHQYLGGLSHERVRIYNTCAGYRYIRARRVTRL